MMHKNGLAAFALVVLAMPLQAQSSAVSLPQGPDKDWSKGNMIEASRTDDIAIDAWSTRWGGGDGGAEIALTYAGSKQRAYVRFTAAVTCSDGNVVTKEIYNTSVGADNPKTEEWLKQNASFSVQCHSGVGRAIAISNYKVIGFD